MNTRVNNTFRGLQGNLENAMTARGFGSSGNMGAGFKGLAIAGANAKQSGEADLRREAMQRWMQSIGMSQSFLTPRTINTTESGESSGEGSQTAPSQTGNIIGGIGFGVSQLLKGLLGGGGGRTAGGGTANTGASGYVGHW